MRIRLSEVMLGLGAVVLIAVTGMGIGWVTLGTPVERARWAEPTTATVTTLDAKTEDDAGWDCARQGNLTCRIDGVLMTSVEGMPADPYGRCVFLLRIAERVDPEGVAFSDQVCGPVRGQLG